jgi:Tfp pilus assembly protein PilF
MRSRNESTCRIRLRWSAGLLVVACLASACGTSGTARPARIGVHESGFTITEETRVGVGVRADFERALRALEAGDTAAGIEGLRKVTEAVPHLTTAHVDLAMAYRRVDDLERAEQSALRALELTPRHPVAHNELGIVYRRTGRFQQARKSYEAALAAFPEFHFARRNLAILCDLYLDDPGCALEHYELYQQALSDDEEVAIWIADLRNRVGE